MPWKNPLAVDSNFNKAAFWVILFLLLTIAFQIRFLNTIAVLLPGFLVLAHPNRLGLIKKAARNSYFLAFLALIIIKTAGLLYTQHPTNTLGHVSGRLMMISIPLFFCSTALVQAKTMQRLMSIFSVALLTVSLVCLVNATIVYSQHKDATVFFYHQLVAPFKHHAIFFSFYLFYCLIYWMEEGIQLIQDRTKQLLIISLLIVFYIFILLLSSKLVIALSFIYLIFFLLRRAVSTRLKTALPVIIIGLLAIALTIVTTDNPVKHRFTDLASGNSKLFQQKKFSPEVYLNGLQFRLLTWRFTYEILNEENAWLFGVSTGDAQYKLNQKYIDANLYQGDGTSVQKGYLELNTHNTFLQTTLESGITGLLILMIIITSFLVQAFKRRKISTIVFFLSIVAFCFTDALLSGQYAMQLFIFFPLLSLYSAMQKKLYAPKNDTVDNAAIMHT